MRILVSILLAGLMTTNVLAAQEFKLSSAQWAQPKRAETVMQMSAIRNAVNLLDAQDANQITIRYPGGESGVLWASELKGWLTSLGVDSSMIRMQPGSTDVNMLDLLVTKKSQ